MLQVWCKAELKFYIRCAADADAIIEEFKNLFPYGEYFYEQFEVVKK